jgi:hypothetical protein
MAAAALLLSVINGRSCSGTRCCPSSGIIAKQATALGSGARSDTGVDSVGKLLVLALEAVPAELVPAELALLLALLLMLSAAVAVLSLPSAQEFSQSMISLELGAHLCLYRQYMSGVYASVYICCCAATF